MCGVTYLNGRWFLLLKVILISMVLESQYHCETFYSSCI